MCEEFFKRFNAEMMLEKPFQLLDKPLVHSFFFFYYRKIDSIVTFQVILFRRLLMKRHSLYIADSFIIWSINA